MLSLALFVVVIVVDAFVLALVNYVSVAFFYDDIEITVLFICMATLMPSCRIKSLFNFRSTLIFIYIDLTYYKKKTF